MRTLQITNVSLYSVICSLGKRRIGKRWMNFYENRLVKIGKRHILTKKGKHKMFNDIIDKMIEQPINMCLKQWETFIRERRKKTLILEYSNSISIGKEHDLVVNIDTY